MAGVCLEDGKLFRLSDPYETHEAVLRNRWKVGTELEGSFVRYNMNDPIHCEDSQWHANRTGRIAEGETLKSALESALVVSLPDGLGITGRGTPVASFQSRGRSIVTIKPESIDISLQEPRAVGGNKSVRADFVCNGYRLRFVPITDIRFFDADGCVNESAVEVAVHHLEEFRAGNEDLYVRVGVTRPFDPQHGTPLEGNLRYWTQIDGLHFFSRSSGRYIRDFDRFEAEPVF